MAKDTDPKPIADLVERTKTTVPIGKLLAELDLEIRGWTRLKMTAATPEDRTKARELEKVITTQAHARRAELIDQVQTGPLDNRVVAAAALGFTHEPEALSPLVACLEDRNPELVGNALLGLMILGDSNTPLERICDLMRGDPDPWVRTNAAQCLSNLVAAGSGASCVLASARLGLTDPEPGVRAHSALLLGTLLDGESAQGLLDVAHDPVPLASAAALRALVWLGGHEPRSKGTVARGLASMLEGARNTQRVQLLRALNQLSGVSYGEETKAWTDWASRLP
ncbi:MAG: HEAT repeat domain-containing protein [Planctomycetes bacterium]|nr:HEAT repeat domain-containing protein [Planctomycetota bacterium]